MKKNNKVKDEILEKMQKVPIIEVVCQQAGISRMTLLRWRREDKKFSEAIDKALLDGRSLISDLAESGLIGHIKDRNLPAILAWLKVHEPRYANKLKITGDISVEEKPLTPEQRKIQRAALRMAFFNENHDTQKEK